MIMGVIILGHEYKPSECPSTRSHIQQLINPEEMVPLSLGEE
jgi:hypothetical protein